MKISIEGIAVTKRFFEAIDKLKAQKTIRGLQTFTNKYEINRRNLIRIKKNPEITLKPEYLIYLVRDYDVSAEWILIGEGSMFKVKN